MIRFAEDYIAHRGSGRFGGELEKNELKYHEEVTRYVEEFYGEVYSLYIHYLRKDKQPV